MFDLFVTLQNKFDSQSSGIGLSVCKKIIEDYGGEIWVDLQVTAGTRICFTLPLTRCQF